MAQEIRDASGALLYYELEHTAQQVDDAIDLSGDLLADYQHLYNGLREYSVPEGLFDSGGETLEDNTGESLEARVVLAAGEDVGSLQRRAAALETLYQAQVSSTQELRQLVQVQAQAIATLMETLSAAQTQINTLTRWLGTAQTQINNLTVHALLDSGYTEE